MAIGQRRSPSGRISLRVAVTNFADWLLFWTGDAFTSQAVVLPLFVQRLTDSPLAVGLIPTIWGFGFFVPQLIAAAYAQRLPYKLWYGIACFSFQRLAMLLLAILSMLWAVEQPMLMLAAFFVLFGVAAIATGTGTPFHQDVVAKVVPVQMRGRLRGYALTIAGIFGTLGGLAARDLLDYFAFPIGFAICFLIAAVLGVISLVFIAFIPEPRSNTSAATTSFGRHFAQIPRILRSDRDFAWFLISRVVFGLGLLGTPFLAVHAVSAFQLPDSATGTLIAAYTGGFMIATLCMAWLTDRFGNKLSLSIGSLAMALSLGLAAWAPSAEWVVIALALSGVQNASYLISGIMIVLEFAPDTERPIYIAIASTIIAPVSIAAPLLGGVLASVVGYRTLFAVALIPALLGWAILQFWVREPRTVRVA